ncbi:MAG: Trk family potassium uptake protein [Lachnospiraceae bacterium]|nr:Trk family potassium uptake protein [Lachnospiraceae bacterium]
MNITKVLNEKLSSFQIIILGFAIVIITGTVFLMLPVSSVSGEPASFINALFTSVSAVCVTGLVVVDTASYWSFFGQAVILILIQIGGIGVITVALFFSIITGRKISIMQRQTIQNALSSPQMGGGVRLTRFIFIISFLTELIGFFFLLPVFVKRYGTDGIWLSLFHSVSAFCNAGFDLMGEKTGDFSSLTSFSDNLYLAIIISSLIIIGGIGFITWNDVATKKFRFKEYKMQTKVVFVTTIILIVVPLCFFFFVDFSDKPLIQRISLSIFQAVTPRTAGFNTADLNEMSDAGRFLIMMLMLIGGSPGSTAGGIKTTTIAVLFANMIAAFRQKENACYFGRRTDDATVKNASTLFLLYIALAVFASMMISLMEGLPMQPCLFEAFSAIGTVGLSLGITPALSVCSRLLLIFLMFFGRIGGMTFIYATFSHRENVRSKFPAESIMIG